MNPYPLTGVARLRKAALVALAVPIAAAGLLALDARAEAAGALKLSDPTPVSGEAVTVNGRVGREQAGRTVVIQYAGADGAWHTLGQTTVRADGAFSLKVRLRSNGALRAVFDAAPSGRAAAAAQVVGTAPQPVAVEGAFRTTTRRIEALSGDTVAVAGHLRPSRAGRQVVLQRRVGREWRTLDSDRTSASGHFSLRYRVKKVGTDQARLRFRGDALNGPSHHTLGQLRVFRTARASYYTLYGGALACGGRLGYDSMVVAHRSLPCGTPVTVRYRGRSVQARVQDRGPFVGGREFDLGGAVARKLGFDGVQTVWVVVGH